jgi:o-succinylbenzoate synthase
MKITNIYTKKLNAPLKTPFVTALREVRLLEDIVVVIECDNGLVGYGEGAPTPAITGETLGSIEATIDYLKPHIIGSHIEKFESILNNIHTLIKANTTAKSALEIALYDLKAQYAKRPLYALLGGEKTTFQTDITISLGSIEKMIADTKDALQRGYTALKIKIGEGIEADSQRIIALHETIASRATLRLDANQGWSAKESVALLHTIEKQGIVAEFIEQPVASHDFEGLKYIKERVQTPLLADESIFSVKDAQHLLKMEAIDYVNIKLAKTGGISQALALADLAKSYGVKCMVGCMLEGPIALSAGLHLASAKADVIQFIDLDAVALLSHNPCQTSIAFNESEITLSDTVGLGVTF